LGKTFPINFERKGRLNFYSVKINSLTIENIDGFTTKTLHFKEGTDKLVVEVGGINANVTVDGSVKGFWLIPLSADYFTIENASAYFEIDTVSDDLVHYTLDVDSLFSVEDVYIHMESGIIQRFVNLAHRFILNRINKSFSKLKDTLTGLTDNLNQKVAHQAPYTFMS